jgi:hypothetical protein
MAFTARCQDNTVVTKIEYTTLTRGYQKQIFITPDSLIRIIEGREENNKIVKRKLAAGEWEEITKAISKTPVSEIAQLKSPTSRRAFDGARHSTIVIFANDGNSYTHSFDDENPHEKLAGLMEILKKLDGDDSSGRNK